MGCDILLLQLIFRCWFLNKCTGKSDCFVGQHGETIKLDWKVTIYISFNVYLQKYGSPMVYTVGFVNVVLSMIKMPAIQINSHFILI